MSITIGRRILARDENTLIALDFHDDIDRTVVATATRKGPRGLWYVYLREHVKTRTGRTETPHARISGRLPEDVQRRLLAAILEAV